MTSDFEACEIDLDIQISFLNVIPQSVYIGLMLTFDLCPGGCSLDDLLKAGIRKALHLVISSIGAARGTSSNERWEDAETVVMVQKITR